MSSIRPVYGSPQGRNDRPPNVANSSAHGLQAGIGARNFSGGHQHLFRYFGSGTALDLVPGFEVIVKDLPKRRRQRSSRRMDSAFSILPVMPAEMNQTSTTTSRRREVRRRQRFTAVWTPERHFHAFGGLFPNPSVTSAAVAAVTTRIQIRAGSVVLPLHHPRACGGRVVGSGQPFERTCWNIVRFRMACDDFFVFAPQHYSDRKSG